ncbi:unnamed protein product [Lampetra fluviatilis]
MAGHEASASPECEDARRAPLCLLVVLVVVVIHTATARALGQSGCAVASGGVATDASVSTRGAPGLGSNPHGRGENQSP